MRLRRRHIDQPVDWLRSKLDQYPRDYQPLPWENESSSAGRATGTASRWRAMEQVVDKESPRTALDIGANNGWFSFALARKGVATVALEREPRHYRTILHASSKIGDGNVFPLIMNLNQKTVSLLPHGDCTVFLSVWHHLVREMGLEVATDMLRQIWTQTGKVMFFETGQNEMSNAFGLPPMGEDPLEWLLALLRSACPDATVDTLGQHVVPDRLGGEASRYLFAVRR